MPNTRDCRDCGASLALYNGNCVRCYSCRAIHRREVWNKADKKRRRAAKIAAMERAAARAADPEPTPEAPSERFVTHRVTAKQVAAYMQAYAPKSYNNIVREIRNLHQKIHESALTTHAIQEQHQ